MNASSLSLRPGASLTGNRGINRRLRNSNCNGLNGKTSVVAIAAAVVSVSASASSSSRGSGSKFLDGPGRAAKLRELLAKPGILVGPAVYDGMSARLVEKAGFPFAFSSGFSIAAARLGRPDVGLLSYSEVLSSLRDAVEATERIPIIADGDTGYGNEVAVKRTVRGFASAGAAGILIEDQMATSKACGHVSPRGSKKKVVSREEALARVRAAVDARDEVESLSPGVDSRIVIVARSDARQAESLEEALWRAAAFADLGADVVFVDALASVDEMRRLAAAVPSPSSPSSPSSSSSTCHIMANNLEGGGRSPVLSPRELEEMGFKLVAYPLSLLGASVRAQQRALEAILEGRATDGGVGGLAELLPSFDELKEVVGFDEYFDEVERYSFAGNAGSAAAAEATFSPPPPPPPEQEPSPAAFASRKQGEGEVEEEAPSTTPLPSSSSSSSSSSEPSPSSSSLVPVEPDSIIVDGESASSSSGSSSSSTSSTSMQRVDFLRVRISNEAGAVKLETRIPAGFVRGLSAIVPQVAGMLDLDEIAKIVSGDAEWNRSKPVFESDVGADEKIQIFLD